MLGRNTAFVIKHIFGWLITFVADKKFRWVGSGIGDWDFLSFGVSWFVSTNEYWKEKNIGRWPGYTLQSFRWKSMRTSKCKKRKGFSFLSLSRRRQRFCLAGKGNQMWKRLKTYTSFRKLWMALKCVNNRLRTAGSSNYLKVANTFFTYLC